MFSLARMATWAWVVLLVGGLAAIVLGIQYTSGRSFSAAAAPAGPSGALGNPRTSDLAELARRGREHQRQLLALREQLAGTQGQTDLLHERAATLEAMLAGDSLTQCPVFLQEETTVRALQGIIREAVASDAPGNDAGVNRLDTAATIARSRLRRRLEMLREDRQQQALGLEDLACDLRGRIRQQAAELESFQSRINRHLRAAASAPPAPAG